MQDDIVYRTIYNRNTVLRFTDSFFLDPTHIIIIGIFC